MTLLHPLFLVPEYGKTFGELPPEVKQQMSHRARAFDVDQHRQSDAERVADPQQGRDARVALAVLDGDHHPAAHPGAVGQLVEGPAAGGAVLADPLTDELVDRDRLDRHLCRLPCVLAGSSGYAASDGAT